MERVMETLQSEDIERVKWTIGQVQLVYFPNSGSLKSFARCHQLKGLIPNSKLFSFSTPIIIILSFPFLHSKFFNCPPLLLFLTCLFHSFLKGYHSLCLKHKSQIALLGLQCLHFFFNTIIKLGPLNDKSYEVPVIHKLKQQHRNNG